MRAKFGLCVCYLSFYQNSSTDTQRIFRLDSAESRIWEQYHIRFEIEMPHAQMEASHELSGDESDTTSQHESSNTAKIGQQLSALCQQVITEISLHQSYNQISKINQKYC